MLTTRLTTAALVVLCTAGPARAQAVDEFDPSVPGWVMTPGVAVGATFDDNFKLVRILDGRCALFLFGDQSFELCAQQKK